MTEKAPLQLPAQLKTDPPHSLVMTRPKTGPPPPPAARPAATQPSLFGPSRSASDDCRFAGSAGSSTPRALTPPAFRPAPRPPPPRPRLATGSPVGVAAFCFPDMGPPSRPMIPAIRFKKTPEIAMWRLLKRVRRGWSRAARVCACAPLCATREILTPALARRAA